MTVQAVFLVACGGAIGAVLRFGVGAVLKTPGFPWATLGVNLLGSLAMGLLMGWLLRQPTPQEALRLFLAVGLLGGFATFSAFSMDVFALIEKRDALALSGYVGGSLLGGLALFVAGFLLMRTG